MKEDDIQGTLDLVIERIGQWGWYNIFTYLLIFFPLFHTGVYGASYVFIAGDIDYRCQVPECESSNNTEWLKWAIPSGDIHLAKCKRYAIDENVTIDHDNASCSADIFDRKALEDCDQFVYDSENTIVREFNLGCQEWKRTLVGSIDNAGLFVSIIITGIFSDRFGRKSCIITTSIINGILGFVRTFSTNYLMFMLLLFLESALTGGLFSCAFVLAMEIVTPKNRSMVNGLANSMYSLGLIVSPILAWLIPDWRIILRIMYAPAIVMILYIFLMDESVRWLLARGKNEQAIDILKKIAKYNGRDFPDAVITKLENESEIKNRLDRQDRLTKENQINTVQRKSTLVQILRSRVLIIRLVLCSFLWITCTFTYYGLSINSVSLSGNKYLNYILVILIEIPSNIAGIFIMDRVGRRKTLIMNFMVAGICCTSMAFIQRDYSVIILSMYMIGKFTANMAFTCIYVYTSELFPTNLRQSLFGVCSTFGRLGSILAPQVPLIGYYMESLPSILFGALSLAAGGASLLLPETNKQKLPDSITEIEETSRKTT